ncbi:hypothetical protein GCM10009657_38180 [Oryzihumus leptocrescens]
MWNSPARTVHRMLSPAFTQIVPGMNAMVWMAMSWDSAPTDTRQVRAWDVEALVALAGAVNATARVTAQRAASTQRKRRRGRGGRGELMGLLRGMTGSPSGTDGLGGLPPEVLAPVSGAAADRRGRAGGGHPWPILVRARGARLPQRGER